MTAHYPKQPGSYPNTRQRIPYTSTAASSSAFGSQTYQVRLSASSPIFYLVFSTTDSSSTAASTSGDFLPQNWVEFIGVHPGQKISIVAAGTDGAIVTANGTAYVTEMA
jgi:hypothetical protein